MTLRSGRTTLRVRYAETDRMQVTYYANYLVWFEVARTELMRDAGYSYRRLESEGISLPIIRGEYALHAPSHYDDELVIDTRIVELRTRRVIFAYEVRRGDVLVATGSTTHVPVDASRHVVMLPDAVRAAMTTAD